MIMKRKSLFIIFALSSHALFAQEPAPSLQGRSGGEFSRETTHTTLFGIGRVNHLDTYLSPLNYRGPQLNVLHETHRKLSRNAHILYTTFLQGELSYTESPRQNVHEMGGSFRYDTGWGRQWTDALWKGLDLAAGGMVGGTLGFLYNSRNGNNPAQARVAVQAQAFVRSDYCFKVKKQTLQLHYQVHLPLVGTTFMPQYGQSYYDIFDRGIYDRNIRAIHPGNALSLRQLFTVEIPVRHAKLSLGYLSDLRQARVNGIRQHQYGRSLVIGYVRELSIKR